VNDDKFEKAARKETEAQDAELIDKPSFYAGFLAGAHLFDERAEALAEAVERVHKLSLLGTNAISIEASRLCNQALRAFREGGEG